MGAIASQITSLTIIFSTIYLDTDQRKHQSSGVTGLCAGNSPEAGEFSVQMASDDENVSIWWRHHEITFGWTYKQFLRTVYASLDLLQHIMTN